MSWWDRYVRGADAIEVIPGLRVGAELSRRGARALARAGVTHAVDLRGESAAVTMWPKEVITHNYPLVEYEAPGVEELHLASSGVATLIQQGETVYVHCRVGIQRAPLVACAVLIQLGWSLADAYRVVSSRRAVAAISEEQLVVLRRLADMIGPRLALDAPTA